MAEITYIPLSSLLVSERRGKEAPAGQEGSEKEQKQAAEIRERRVERLLQKIRRTPEGLTLTDAARTFVHVPAGYVRSLIDELIADNKIYIVEGSKRGPGRTPSRIYERRVE